MEYHHLVRKIPGVSGQPSLIEIIQPAGFLPLRKTYNTTGKDIIIRLNQFKVEQWPQRDVYQFDVRSTPSFLIRIHPNRFYRSTLAMVLKSLARLWLLGSPLESRTISRRSILTPLPFGMATRSCGMYFETRRQFEHIILT